jgi:hypothetical protein
MPTDRELKIRGLCETIASANASIAASFSELGKLYESNEALNLTLYLYARSATRNATAATEVLLPDLLKELN